jgi:hypothetical protein
MLLDPTQLVDDLDRLEEIEKASLRLVVQAIYDYRETAIEIFHEESDLVADIGEDITREALDRMGVSKIDQRLFGKIDYKRACYLFHPDFAVRQALFVDSKAEKVSGQRTATLQTSQLSMVVRQVRAGEEIEVAGSLPQILTVQGTSYITTTIFVKYNYAEGHGRNVLNSVTIAAVPNGLLQERYNPSPQDSIWLAGRNAPTLGEAFRVRISFSRLRTKAGWRVQKILLPPHNFVWAD